MFTSPASRFTGPMRLNRMGKGVGYFGLVALLAMTAATAQVAALDNTGLDASGNPRSETATCNSGSTHQDSAACLREVRNANAEKNSGQLGGGGDYNANALRRCDVFTTPEDKAACVARVGEQSKLDGTVANGGVLRQSAPVAVPATPR